MIKLIYLCCIVALITISSSAPINLKPLKTFRDCPECPEMIVIPAGSFMMGCLENDSSCSPQEKPLREIKIRQFAAGKFDVTRGEWRAFVAATNRPTSGGCVASALPIDSLHTPWDLNPSASWKNLGFTQDDSHPVVCITWNDAQEYIRWLSKKTGADYRLLTEAEWEYAARAGTTTPFPWGSTATHEYANYGRDNCCEGRQLGDDQWTFTSPVGSFPPNAFGLYDMNGNVLQYVQDCFANSYSAHPTDGTAYTGSIELKMTERFSWMDGKNSCSFHMIRGGCWGDPPEMIRSSFRNWSPGPGATLENYSSAGLGFRVAKTLQ